MDIVDSSLLGGSGWAKAKSGSMGGWSNKNEVHRKLQLQLHQWSAFGLVILPGAA